ncbi:hypothetical protein ACN077_25035 [Clostridium chromiireducens]|uniref:hypothetical protein n=1 Tax=Clostridium chromiireducens TaxID=225345 RepID=UPI003AF93606
MLFNYSEYLKYKLILQTRRKLSSIEKFLTRFFPKFPSNSLLLIGIYIFKYISEVFAVAIITYNILKNRSQSTNILIFSLLLFYFIIYTTKIFINNYNKIIKPEDDEFLRTFPIGKFERRILTSINTFVFCIVETFFKRIFQLYIPSILVLKELNIFSCLFGSIVILYISFCLAIIFIYIKFLVTKDGISFLKFSFYLSICIAIYNFMKKIIYNCVMIFNTFPYESIKLKNVGSINDWINKTYINARESIVFYIDGYLLNKYSLVLSLRQIILRSEVLLNSLLLLAYIISLSIIFVVLMNYINKQYNINYVKNKDMVSIFAQGVILIITKFNKLLCGNDSSIYNIMMKDLKIFKNTREFVNNGFFNIFGRFSIWIFLGLVNGVIEALNSIDNSIYTKCFRILIFFIAPLFIALHLHEKMQESFKFIFFINGENRNINIFKITGYPMEKLFKSKKIIFFLFSSPIYLILAFSYLTIFKLSLNEIIMILLNFTIIYYFSCNFYLSGSLLNDDFNWRHIDDLGNNFGQKYISNTLINVFQFFYSMISGLFSIFYYINALELIFFLYIITILILYYIKNVILRKALLQVNNIIYSEDI